MAGEPVAPGSFSPPAVSPQQGDPSGNDAVNFFMQWLSSVGGGQGPPQGGFGGGNQMGLPPGLADALGIGMGGDALGPGGMINPAGIGLNPAQAAGLRLRQNNMISGLNQAMANKHRAIGRAGGRDYSRQVQNINDEVLALQEQKIQNNIQNAFAYNKQLQDYAQQNFANNMKLSDAIKAAGGNIFRYGKPDQDAEESPGTFSSTPEAPA